MYKHGVSVALLVSESFYVAFCLPAFGTLGQASEPVVGLEQPHQAGSCDSTKAWFTGLFQDPEWV